jgi:hypothetical protein
MAVIATVLGIVQRALDALDLLDFVVSPLRHWESWRATANPVQFFFACLTGLALILVVGFWVAGRFGAT